MTVVDIINRRGPTIKNVVETNLITYKSKLALYKLLLLHFHSSLKVRGTLVIKVDLTHVGLYIHFEAFKRRGGLGY